MTKSVEKKKSQFDERMENLERSNKAAVSKAESAAENLRAAAELMRKRGR